MVRRMLDGWTDAIRVMRNVRASVRNWVARSDQDHPRDMRSRHRACAPACRWGSTPSVQHSSPHTGTINRGLS